jgi:hypothetical protein
MSTHLLEENMACFDQLDCEFTASARLAHRVLRWVEQGVRQALASILTPRLSVISHMSNRGNYELLADEHGRDVKVSDKSASNPGASIV